MSRTIRVNGQVHTVEVSDDKPLLWVLREDLGLTGTKFGCGIAQCGACTVYLDGRPTRSCVVPISALGEQNVTTIEGNNSPAAIAVQSAWRDLTSFSAGTVSRGS